VNSDDVLRNCEACDEYDTDMGCGKPDGGDPVACYADVCDGVAEMREDYIRDLAAMDEAGYE
jgi:hypothetical protein